MAAINIDNVQGLTRNGVLTRVQISGQAIDCDFVDVTVECDNNGLQQRAGAVPVVGNAWRADLEIEGRCICGSEFRVVVTCPADTGDEPVTRIFSLPCQPEPAQPPPVDSGCPELVFGEPEIICQNDNTAVVVLTVVNRDGNVVNAVWEFDDGSPDEPVEFDANNIATLRHVFPVRDEAVFVRVFVEGCDQAYHSPAIITAAECNPCYDMVLWPPRIPRDCDEQGRRRVRLMPLNSSDQPVRVRWVYDVRTGAQTEEFVIPAGQFPVGLPNDDPNLRLYEPGNYTAVLIIVDGLPGCERQQVNFDVRECPPPEVDEPEPGVGPGAEPEPEPAPHPGPGLGPGADPVPEPDPGPGFGPRPGDEDGEPWLPGGGGEHWACFSVRLFKVLATVFVILAGAFALCAALQPLVPAVMFASMIFAALWGGAWLAGRIAGFFGAAGLVCPKPCQPALLWSWQVWLTVGLSLLVVGTCCFPIILWAAGAIIFFALGLIGKWMLRCNLWWCAVAKEAARVLIPAMVVLIPIVLVFGAACFQLWLEVLVGAIITAIVVYAARCRLRRRE
jgi:hypothetical protein